MEGGQLFFFESKGAEGDAEAQKKIPEPKTAQKGRNRRKGSKVERRSYPSHQTAEE